MENHSCKLCFRTFFNGRALGGHMRSHMMNLPLSSKPEESPFLLPRALRISEEEELATFPSSSPSSSEGDAAEDDLYYGLRENPKRSFKISDPEFSFAGSVILQDRESETESSKNPTRRRSKRNRKLAGLNRFFNEKPIQNRSEFDEEDGLRKMKLRKLSQSELWTEPEPVSSISDSTTEEDVAFCLMMLSRDNWFNRLVKVKSEEQEQEEEKSMEEEDDSEEIKFSKIQNRGKYKCEPCNKAFRSYQALGGHRASHKKMKLSSTLMAANENGSSSVSMAGKRIHECPVCFRVFSSGQALGGHKRSHLIYARTSPAKPNPNLIDLNLPAPIDDDDDLSQIELSAVSDAEFIKPVRI